MKKYTEIIKEYLYRNAKTVLKPAYKRLQFPFVDPGEGYEGNLWDWDSYWISYALLYALRKDKKGAEAAFGVPAEEIVSHVKGCVQNFLALQEEDGFEPTVVTGDGILADFFTSEHKKGTRLNQIKPFLCQAAYNVSDYLGDYQWFDVEKLIKYLEYYEKNQQDEGTGLFVWENDIMIGIDNNPTVFFRPTRSSADIYLNSFLYLEYTLLAKMLTKLKDGRAVEIARKGESLKQAINTYMWDKRDGIYYSQDMQFFRTQIKVGEQAFHENLLPHWKTMPLRIRFWGCFLPLYVGICDERQAKSLIAHLKDEAVMAKYGIRTLAGDETMYSLEKSSNPSNWLGAIWTVSNYCVWKGLCRYREKKLSKKLCRATVALIGKNLVEYGDMFESYQPDSGEPNMYPGFICWNLLLLEMLDHI